MGFLVGGDSKSNSEQTQKLDHVQLSSCAYGQVIPIIYGMQRVSPLLIWLNEFQAHEHKKEVGKGFSQEQTTYTYTACVQFALCEGPLTGTGLVRVWEDKKVRRFGPTDATGAPFEVASAGPRSNPTPWTHLSSAHASEALGYGGTAWVAHSTMDLGDNGSLKNYSIEVLGFQATITAPNITYNATSLSAYDAHPASIIVDLLTNKEYGLGWDASRIDVVNGADGTAASGYTRYCHANGFYLSLAMTEQKPGLDWLREILKCTNSAAVWSQGVLKILPYGDSSATGNSYTYTPDNTAIYDLTNNDFLPVEDGDPIRVERSNIQDCYNSVPIEWLDRNADYKVTVAEDPDQADVEAFGLRRADPIQAHSICRGDVALALSRLAAQRNIWIRNKYTFRLPQRYILLEPMDLVTLTESKLGLDQKVVRITDIKEDPDGSFEIVAEEWPFGTGTHTLYSGQTGDGATVFMLTDPGNATAPVGFVPTLQLSNGDLQFWLVTAGGNDWGGAYVYLSDDTSTFEIAGTTKRGRWGTLVNTITSSSTTITVDLSASQGTLDSTSATGAADDLTKIWIDGEVFSYQTATLTGAYTYQLTGCLRARQSTVAAAHTAGAYVIRLDDGVFKHPLAYNRLGTNVYVKLVSFNTKGLATQDISTLSYYTFAVPASPDILPKVTGVSITIQTTEFP